MESIASLKDVIQKGDFMEKLNLKDAYLPVPIMKEHQLYVGRQAVPVLDWPQHQGLLQATLSSGSTNEIKRYKADQISQWHPHSGQTQGPTSWPTIWL